MKHLKEKSSHKRNVFNFLRWPILAVQAIVSILVIGSINKLALLKPWQNSLVVIFILILLAFNILKLFSEKSKTSTKAICLLGAIVLSIVFSFAHKYARQTIDFIQDATGDHYETQTYSVLVLNSGNFTEISQLKNQSVGFLSTNPNLEATKNRLSTEITYRANDYEELGAMMAALSGYRTSAIVLSDSYLEYLEEEQSDFYQSTRSIFTFEVRSEETDSRKPVEVATEPFIVYISGSDSRGGIRDIARSDVNILAVINPAQNKILLVSIPRDYYVQLHGTTGTRDKLTHAGIYGINMSRQTIEDLLGYDINYTVKVGFHTVERVVDVLDGVDIYSDKAFKGANSCYFTEGVQHLDGKCALSFSRERYAYESGDRHRGQNQQAVLTAIIKKLQQPKYAVKYSDILKAAEGSFETSLTYEEITDFARYQLNSLAEWQVESISLDGYGDMLPTYSMGAQRLYVMIPDESTIANAKQKIAEYLEQ